MQINELMSHVLGDDESGDFSNQLTAAEQDSSVGGYSFSAAGGGCSDNTIVNRNQTADNVSSRDFLALTTLKNLSM